MIEKNNKEGLIKLIQENPTLPIVFFVDNDSVAYDYGSSVMNSFYSDVREIWYNEDRYYDDYDEIHDKYRDNLCDEEGFKDIEDDEKYDKAVDEWINKNIEHYKAIVVSVS